MARYDTPLRSKATSRRASSSGPTAGEVQNATEIDPEYRSEDPRPERTLAERLVLVLVAADPPAAALECHPSAVVAPAEFEPAIAAGRTVSSADASTTTINRTGVEP